MISLSVSFGVIILLVVAGCLSCFIVRRVFHKPVHRNSSQDMARVINSDCGDTNLVSVLLLVGTIVELVC